MDFEPLNLCDYLNCILVSENKRNAYLLQPIDYNEFSNSDPITKNKIRKIREFFPDLILSDSRQGVMISRKKWNSKLDNSYSAIAKFLDFPCSIPSEDENRIVYNVNVETDYETISLYTFASTSLRFVDMTNEKIALYTECFNTDYRTKYLVRRVFLDINQVITAKDCINLILKDKITDYVKSEVTNYIENMGFEDYHEITDLIDWTNKIHIGIVVGLLSYSQNDILSPFYPLQNYPLQFEENILITRKWKSDLIDILSHA